VSSHGSDAEDDDNESENENENENENEMDDGTGRSRNESSQGKPLKTHQPSELDGAFAPVSCRGDPVLVKALAQFLGIVSSDKDTAGGTSTNTATDASTSTTSTSSGHVSSGSTWANSDGDSMPKMPKLKEGSAGATLRDVAADLKSLTYRRAAKRQRGT